MQYISYGSCNVHTCLDFNISVFYYGNTYFRIITDFRMKYGKSVLLGSSVSSIGMKFCCKYMVCNDTYLSPGDRLHLLNDLCLLISRVEVGHVGRVQNHVDVLHEGLVFDLVVAEEEHGLLALCSGLQQELFDMKRKSRTRYRYIFFSLMGSLNMKFSCLMHLVPLFNMPSMGQILIHQLTIQLYSNNSK